MGVVAGFVMLVGVLVLVIVCVFAMLRRQREKNKALEESGVCVCVLYSLYVRICWYNYDCFVILCGVLL